MRRFLSILCLSLAVAQAGAAVGWWAVPADLAAQLSVMPWFEGAASAVWAGAFAWVGVGLWRRTVTLWQGMVLLSLFSIYIALHTTVFARTAYDQQRLGLIWAVAAALSLLAMALYTRRQP